jgi:hypothetical protein
MTSVNDLSLDDHRQDRRLARWLALVGATDAKVPRDNVRSALRFLAERLPATPANEALSFLMAMDLSKIVSPTKLTVGTRLIGFREAGAPRKGDTRPDLRAKFFAFPGASPHRLGIHVASRVVVHYNVHTEGWALSSYASGALDYWTEDAPPHGATSTFAAMSLGTTGMHPTFSSIKLNTTGVHATGGDRQLLLPQAWRYVEIVQP